MLGFVARPGAANCSPVDEQFLPQANVEPLLRSYPMVVMYQSEPAHQNPPREGMGRENTRWYGGSSLIGKLNCQSISSISSDRQSFLLSRRGRIDTLVINKGLFHADG